jgi:cell division septum initiation protein DivIVA
MQQQANRQLKQQNADLEASNAQLQAEVQRLRQIQATVAQFQVKADAPMQADKVLGISTPQASTAVGIVKASTEVAQSTPAKQKISAKEIINVGNKIQEELTGLNASMDAVCEQLSMPCDTAAVIADMRHLCRLLKRKTVSTLGSDIATLFEHMCSVLKFVSDSKVFPAA